MTKKELNDYLEKVEYNLRYNIDCGDCDVYSTLAGELVFEHDDSEDLSFLFTEKQKSLFLSIKFYKKHAKPDAGTMIRRSDKKKIFVYSNYDSASDFAEGIASFVRGYFESFKLVRE